MIKYWKKFLKKSFLLFRFFSVCTFQKAHPKISLPGSFNILIFLFCLKEHLKAQGMMGLFFLIKPLFGQNTASYMIWLPFFDTFFSHWTCDSFFALKNGLFQKKGHVMPCALRCSFKQNKKLIYWMNLEVKFWDAKWVIFDPCLAHISLKPKNFWLKILW